MSDNRMKVIEPSRAPGPVIENVSHLGPFSGPGGVAVMFLLGTIIGVSILNFIGIF